MDIDKTKSYLSTFKMSAAIIIMVIMGIISVYEIIKLNKANAAGLSLMKKSVSQQHITDLEQKAYILGRNSIIDIKLSKIQSSIEIN